MKGNITDLIITDMLGSAKAPLTARNICDLINLQNIHSSQKEVRDYLDKMTDLDTIQKNFKNAKRFHTYQLKNKKF
jgi:repressor of nif and glnA expression